MPFSMLLGVLNFRMECVSSYCNFGDALNKIPVGLHLRYMPNVYDIGIMCVHVKSWNLTKIHVNNFVEWTYGPIVYM